MLNDAVCEDRPRAMPLIATDKAISRARLKELFALAAEAVEWAEAKGVKRGEQCILREMCERLWWAD